MSLELSTKTKKIARTAQLSCEELAYADLVATGWDATDAYLVAFRKGSTWVKKALADEVERLLNNQNVKSRIDETRRVLSERQKEAIKQTNKKERNAVVDTAMSKEQMLYDLQTAVATMAPGSKEWLDTKKLIVDVTRMKQDEVAKDDSTIHYFLPVQYPTGCQDCVFSRCDSCRYKKACEEGE